MRAGDGRIPAQWQARPPDRLRPHNGYAEIVRLHLVPGPDRHRLTALRLDPELQLSEAKLNAAFHRRPCTTAMPYCTGGSNQAVRSGYIVANVCDRIDPPKVPRREVTPPTAQEL